MKIQQMLNENSTINFQNILETPIQSKVQLNYLQYIILVLTFYFVALILKYLAFVIWNLIKALKPQANLLSNYSNRSQSQKEDWAVVTGGTDGIGLGFCQELAQKGFNLCIISRDQQKLEKIAKKLQDERPQKFKNKKIKIIQFDFTNIQNQTKCKKLLDQISNLEICLLVNNVGIAPMNYYENLSFKEIIDTINVNCITMALLNKVVIEKMKVRKQKSGIVNVSSMSGVCTTPLFSLYSSTKAFNKILSDSLSLENPEIDMISITAMQVVSASTRVKRKIHIPNGRECGRDSLRQLKSGQYTSHGFFMHRIVGELLVTLIPKYLVLRISKRFVGKMITRLRNKKEQ